ncbi:hypothetical protein DPMN_047790 [Dreissena polymorpha]|uniref:Uncharacterized protein n=1 Tax=Dreissena polymorpha TaxID=45954 RepID=A0A9D4DAD0_DREPO|nr:hypothetical protein DPMN_047790 [Dreissena polymorpha]
MQPPWATELLSEIKGFKDKMKSINRIEQTFNSIAAKVSDLETKVKDIDCRVQHTETSAHFLGSKLDDNSEGLLNISSTNKQINKSCTHLEEKYRALEALEIEDRGKTSRSGDKVHPQQFCRLLRSGSHLICNCGLYISRCRHHLNTIGDTRGNKAGFCTSPSHLGKRQLKPTTPDHRRFSL